MVGSLNVNNQTGWSQVKEQFIGNDGKSTVKGKFKVENQQLYASDKVSNPFKSNTKKTEHKQKLGGGVSQITKSLTNEFGKRFGPQMMKKIAFGNNVTPKSISANELEKINKGAMAFEKNIRQEFAGENLDFTKEKSNYFSKTTKTDKVQAFKDLYEKSVATDSDCSILRINNPDRYEYSANIDYESKMALDALYQTVRNANPDALNDTVFQQMDAAVNSASKEIDKNLDEAFSRFAKTKTWKDL